MKNKILGAWMIGTLVGALVAYFFNQDLAGLIIVANWIFVFIGGNRLMVDELNNK